jgi:hypothetical protein
MKIPPNECCDCLCLGRGELQGECQARAHGDLRKIEELRSASRGQAGPGLTTAGTALTGFVTAGGAHFEASGFGLNFCSL